MDVANGIDNYAKGIASMRDTVNVGRICIVANELPFLFRNGGIGTHNWLLADTLADAGWSVHILYCAEIADPAQLTRCRQLLNAKGIALWHLDEFAKPADDTVECGLTGWIDKHSMHIRRAIEQLDAAHHFDLLEFAEWSGYGFRTIQAHAIDNALPNTRIIVKLHSSSQWCRDGNRAWLGGCDDLIRDYFERYSFENADHQFSPSQYMLDYADSIGWDVRHDARVVPNCFPASAPKTNKPQAGIPELVFFGRLEARKGLKVFLEMAQSLPASVPLTFLGKETPIDGIPAGQYIAKMLGDRPFKLHANFDRDQAMEYLSGPNRVAIMPSLIENYPYTVIECAANGIPFLASNVGGIPEIVADSDLQHSLLFNPTPRSLRGTVDGYLATDQATRSHYVSRMHELCDSTKNREMACREYSQLLPQTSAPFISTNLERAPQVSTRENPLVSITVPYFNLGSLLPDTLASIAAQDYPNTEVIVVNDGSTDEYALKVWDKMQVKYPHFRFVTQTNQGLGAARNTGLELAKGEFFLPMDADNIGRPDMVSRFVEALQRNPDIDVVTSFFLAFEETADIAERKFSYAYRPCGGPYVAAALRNVYGDANGMSRTASLRSVGGYETEKHTTCEDWELYVKMTRLGHRIDVVPEYLFYYRYRPTSLLRTTDSMLNRRRVLRQFFPSTELPAAEQIGLWTALASFDDQNRQLQLAQYQSAATTTTQEHGVQTTFPEAAVIQRRGMRLAAYNFRHAMRKTTRYEVFFNKLKNKRAA
jgi:O-antigen biosynthesis protein